jgi:hypothetical protein
MSDGLTEVAHKEALRDLEIEVQNWVDKTFNFIQIEVVEKFSDNTMMEYIVNPEPRDMFIDWLGDMDAKKVIKDYLEGAEISDKDAEIQKYINVDNDIKASFISVFGEDKWSSFVDWGVEQHEDDIQDFIQEQENYPMWNTLFEFRDEYYNRMTEQCISVGLGVVEGLDPFNNMVFMTSAGHSFLSAYWIPLYFELHDNAKKKYRGVNYSSI